MPEDPTECPVCGCTSVVWRRCKLVCEGCGTIVMSCADLADAWLGAGGALAGPGRPDAA